MTTREHKVSIVVNAREVLDWTEYAIDTSLIEPADTFQLTRAFDRDAWNACVLDARVRVLLDGQPRIDGFIDSRKKNAKDGTITITGRDRVGRMVEESAPRTKYGGKTLLAVLEELARPWFDRVVLSGVRNRKVTLGRGAKVAGANEAVSLRRGGRGKPKAVDPIAALFAKPAKTTSVDAGRSRWDLLEEMISRLGLCAWSSADGKELIVGKPDQAQPATFTLRHAARGGQSNVVELDYEESNEQRYSLIACVGSGKSSAADFGAAGSRSGVVYDHDIGPKAGPSPFAAFTGPAQRDGTGRDFLFPKWLVLADESVRDNEEARRVAHRDQARRDFKRISATATVDGHGQDLGTGVKTLFAIETMTRLIDEEIDLDDDFLIYAAMFKGDRNGGQTTSLSMVPRGTEVIL